MAEWINEKKKQWILPLFAYNFLFCSGLKASKRQLFCLGLSAMASHKSDIFSFVW